MVQKFIQLAQRNMIIPGDTKLEYHRLGKRVLKAVAAELGLQSGTFDIRSNLGGTVVAGEITLHTDHIYIQFCEPMNGLEVLYRSCVGRKDYSGSGNHWMRFDDLCDLPKACNEFRRVMNGSL